MTDKELEEEIDMACASMENERKLEAEMEKQAQEEEAKLAASLGIDVPTLQRWIKEAA